MFKDVGCYNFFKKLQSSHQQVAEAFALNFDGKKAIIGRDEFEIDEALIAEVTELPMTGEKWFKTTSLETLVEVTVQWNEPEAASNPTNFEQDAEA